MSKNFRDSILPRKSAELFGFLVHLPQLDHCHNQNISHHILLIPLPKPSLLPLSSRSGTRLNAPHSVEFQSHHRAHHKLSWHESARDTIRMYIIVVLWSKSCARFTGDASLGLCLMSLFRCRRIRRPDGCGSGGTR